MFDVSDMFNSSLTNDCTVCQVQEEPSRRYPVRFDQVEQGGPEGVQIRRTIGRRVVEGLAAEFCFRLLQQGNAAAWSALYDFVSPRCSRRLTI